MPKQILIIEDEPQILDYVRKALESEGFQVAAHNTGFHAWEEIIRVRPDLLILDVMLPGVDGYSLGLQMSRNPATKDTPIIVLTAVGATKILFEKLEQVAAFISKPFTAEQITRAVKQALPES